MFYATRIRKKLSRSRRRQILKFRSDVFKKQLAALFDENDMLFEWEDSAFHFVKMSWDFSDDVAILHLRTELSFEICTSFQGPEGFSPSVSDGLDSSEKGTQQQATKQPVTGQSVLEQAPQQAVSEPVKKPLVQPKNPEPSEVEIPKTPDLEKSKIPEAGKAEDSQISPAQPEAPVKISATSTTCSQVEIAMGASISRDQVGSLSSECEAARQQQLVNKQTQLFELEANMDEASQQILHEHRYAEAKSLSEMSSPASTSHAPHNDTPSRSKALPTEFASPQSPQSQISEQSSMSPLQFSLLAGKFSDLEVFHGATRWNAHKVVVFSQSTVLESMVENSKDSISKLNLTNLDYPAVVRLMEYLYHASYTSIDVEPDFFIPTHISIFNLATTFEIPHLQSFAEERFRNALNNLLTDIIVYFACVEYIYGNTTRHHPGLRNAVVEAAVTEMNTLLNDLPAKKMLFKVMAKTPDFQTDILRFLVDNPARPVLVMMQQLCDNCGPMPEEHKYIVGQKCRGCGKDKTMQFY